MTRVTKAIYEMTLGGESTGGDLVVARSPLVASLLVVSLPGGEVTINPKIIIFDNKQNKNRALERKKFVKYLGILIERNLTWKHHVDYVALKVIRVT